MTLILKEKFPFMRDKFDPDSIVWLEAGEELEIVEKKIMRHCNEEWFKVKSKWFKEPFQGFHNPRNFTIKEQTEDRPVKSQGGED